MKKTLLLLSCVIALSFTMLYANPVDISTAKTIGEKFIKSGINANNQRNNVSASLAYTLSSDNGDACLYVFNIADGGFVIVSAEDRVKPILGYSNEGIFNADNIADGFLSTISSFKEEIEYVRNHNIALSDDIATEWKSVSSTGRISESRNTRSVTPLLDITWNQGQYYNNLCPEDEEGPGGHVYAGCVATAMSMVMKYWNHPSQGTGSHSYTPGGWGYPSYPTQTANFGETHYHFELMPTFLDSTSTDDEIFYIAQLQYHCGVAVEMMYSADGSGAYSDDVPRVMGNYFGYNPEMEYHMKDYYYGGDWSEMLKNELNLSHPIYYSGQDDAGNGGHAFVCDGYDENDYFHYNWGWGGKDNGFFAMGALNTTRYNFNSWNGAIEGFYPASEDYFLHPQKATDLSINEIDSRSVTISWTNPELDLSGNALASIDSVIIRRNFHTIASLSNVSVGEAMTYTDVVEEEGVYEYSILVRNSYGYNTPVYQKVMIGDKCDLIFELNDEAANGWRGACISIADENGRRLEVVTMNEGETETRIVPMLKGNMSFIWSPGWFSAVDDHEISFTISDAGNNVIYNSPDSIPAGLMFTYNNNCDTTSLAENVSTKAQVYPNPSNGQITVKTVGMNQVTVYDIVGQEVKTIAAQNDNVIIDMSASQNGIYFLKISTAFGDVTKKIVLSH